MDLVVSCASCFQRLKRAEKVLADEQGNPSIEPVAKHVNIRYLVDFLYEDIEEKVITDKVLKPLKRLTPVCYYGCLSSRPPQITDALHPENPDAMDRLVEMLGSEVKNWSYKTDCCGGNLMITNPDVACRLTRKLVAMAEEAGANCIVTGCPLCKTNIDMGQQSTQDSNTKKSPLPVFYFTELMGIAFGEPSGGWLRAHLVDPRPLLNQLALI